ncbi:MAG: transposase [Candidatus Poribacteria bacterium]|nr:transposase [Candidatus Poribacteria bacterium]
MTYNQENHHRRSLRLKEYDYRQAGAYFVNIVLQDRLCLFGEVIGTEIQLNEAGKMAGRIWKALSNRFPTIAIDTFVVMPNHLHGIIIINQHRDHKSTVGASLVDALPALGDVIGAYKSLTTVEYTRGVKMMKWKPFHRRLWQRNYYEHIIRNDDSLNHIRQYIIDNPGQWAFDKENPLATKAKT